jgi:hypothetical protein
MDSVGTEGADGAAEVAAADEPQARSAEDEAAADDAGSSAGAEMAAPESDAEATFADEAPAEEEAADFDLDPADIDAALAGVPRIDVAEAASPRALRRQVDDRLASDSGEGADDAADDDEPSSSLRCGSAIAQEIRERGPAEAFGSTILDGLSSEFVVFAEPDAVVVAFDAATCAAIVTG